MVLSIIFLEDKHKIVLHLSILYEYQQFFQHRICFSIQPPDYSDPWPRLAGPSSFFLIRLFKYFIITKLFLTLEPNWPWQVPNWLGADLSKCRFDYVDMCRNDQVPIWPEPSRLGMGGGGGLFLVALLSWCHETGSPFWWRKLHDGTFLNIKLI
jgi:hypothetical protein